MLVVCTQSFLSAKADGPDQAASKRQTRQSFKFDPDDGVVLVPVRIGGKEYQFALDTGCTGTVFDASLRPYLGQAIDTIEGRDAAGKDLTLDLYRAPDAQVGSSPLGKLRVASRDFTETRQAAGCNVRGFLGMDFLKDWIITIDFDEGRLDFLPPGTAKLPAWGEGIPLEYDDSGIPRIRGTVGKNLEPFFTVDTGYDGTGQLEEVFLMLLVDDSHEARMTGDTQSVTFSGLHLSDTARLSLLTIGSFRHENLRFISGHRNCLGLRYFSRYRVTD